MKPVNTFASELLRKVSKKDTYLDMNADQVMLSMMVNPRAWYFVPFIYIKKDNTRLRDLIGIPHDQKYARFADLFTEEGVYKLTDAVAVAHKKKIKNKYEESVLNVDGRAPQSDFTHTCDTAGGSSGAPVFNLEGQLVGVHHFGFADDVDGLWTENRSVHGDLIAAWWTECCAATPAE